MTGDLWAITCYFNPIGYRSRIENYHVFRERLAVPLVTVELSFESGFQLRNGDADTLVQVHGQSVLWQKERLLNVALRRVPGTCSAIAWLDCDVVFEDPEWARRARMALDEYPLLRLFHKRYDLSPHESLDEIPAQAGADWFEGAVPLDQVRSPGLAWAGRRDLLDQHGLYDACVLGSGDRAVFYAALGHFDEAARRLRMNGRRFNHYLAWAERFHDAIRGRVGYIHGRMFHLWHGDRSNRDYRQRHRLLEDFDFDPDRDIGIDPNGCWGWTSEKPDLHEAVKRYFSSRNEDGEIGCNSSPSPSAAR